MLVCTAMPVKLASFYEDFQSALDEDASALFVGAGLSVAAGYVNWKDLLRNLAADLDLDIDKETDLVALAQFHVNHSGGRAGVNRTLITELTKNATPTENHRLIADLPVSSLWTTNYDHLIEDALRAINRLVDRKVSKEDLARTRPRRDAVVYKMHGDIDRPEDAVLTKQDYDHFDRERNPFAVQLQGDLMSKTFLFLGFSFTDPNIEYVLARLRSSLKGNQRNHYWVVRDVQQERDYTSHDVSRQKHRIQDLKGYGIRSILINSYSEITEMLRELRRRAHRKGVFISGSAHDYGAFGKDRAIEFLRNVGSRLVLSGFNVVCGMGLGVGDAVCSGAIEAVYRQQGESLEKRTTLRPFPQAIPDPSERKRVWRRYREDLLARGRSVIFVFGNKWDASRGTVIEADGVREEFEIACAEASYPIPIGSTGSVAAEIWTTVRADLAKYFGGHATAVAPHFDVLGQTAATDDELTGAVLAILKIVTPK